MRVLCIGSSHVGALVRAWKNISYNFPAAQFEFIGSHSYNLQDARLEDGKISNAEFASEKGEDPVTSFDAFVIVANILPIRPIYNDLLKYQYSAHVKETALSDMYVNTINHFVLKTLLRPETNAPVYMLSMPERRGANILIDAAKYLDTKNRLTKVIQNDNVSYIAQPRKTLDDNFKPRDKFYTDAVNMRGQIAGNQLKASVGHLNNLGGEIILREIIGRINSV